MPAWLSDFHQDGQEATIELHEKGDKRRIIGLRGGAETIREYIEHAEPRSGDFSFVPRSAHELELGHANDPATMCRVIQRYLERLPGAMKCSSPTKSLKREVRLHAPLAEGDDGHASLRHRGAAVDIRKVQELLGHRHITTTQIYDKRRRFDGRECEP